ncbi:MAG: LacI family DNA-binding transcriptional regulator [Sphaerochaetaceae bacterium]|nr:LacI family DNA-binding transcriptional regulator [Sphaerochaetaceae bacterium]MDC7250113.1 LacI family DNA-binding transcriptional regulator [Sphaerochaetaceae bacterium]
MRTVPQYLEIKDNAMDFTIIDIANKAKVSKSTVSRVLNNSGYVSEKAREKVNKAVKELNYVPSAMAQGLSKKTSNTVGVLIPELQNYFFTELLQGLSEVVDNKGMTLIFSDTANDPIKQEKALLMIKGQRVKGLILTPANEYSSKKQNLELIKSLKALHLPIVIVDREIPDSPWDTVLFENFNAGYLATKALIKGGNKTIGIITGDMNLKIARERYDGYLCAMKEHNIEIDKKYIFNGDFTANTAYEITKNLFENSSNVPDGFVTCNNQSSIGFLRATLEKNLKAGKDFAVVGIDKINLIKEFNIPFSYINRDTYLMGKKAMEILIDRSENPTKEKMECIMPAKFVSLGTEKKK